jgi:UDPglucose 6-dehydrogenase
VLRVAVVGLWHLGVTIAACLAEAGARVIATDPAPDVVGGLAAGRLPVEEPGLADLVRAGQAAGRLRFEADPLRAVIEAEVVWIAFDTPVDARDEADVGVVRRESERLLPALAPGATVLVSSQVPVGFTRALREAWATAARPPGLRFACSPENLRLGKALDSFRRPARVVIGTDDGGPDERLRALFAPFATDLLWMSLESAEFTKHAVNAFLATSVAFANELARLAERVGADAREVERGLKSEPRIGPGAYLSPGPAFAGGTLARDLRFLHRLGGEAALPMPLVAGVLASNADQAGWLRGRISALLGEVQGVRVAVWGLTYKPSTDTLRRSAALELCGWLAARGAQVRAHDPAVRALPPEVTGVELAASPSAALRGAELLVLATAWPDYRAVAADDVVSAMKVPRVVDEAGFLAATLGRDPRIAYVAVGTPRAGRGGRTT